MFNLFGLKIDLKSAATSPTTEIDWLSRQDPTQLWEEWKHLEPLAQVANGKIKNSILPGTHPLQNRLLRVVAASDTHSLRLSQLDLPAGDVLVLAGDITMYGSEREVLELDLEIEKLLKTKQYRKVIAIGGNHDEFLESFVSLSKRPGAEKKPPFKNCIYLRDQSVTICGVKFYGSPWVPFYRAWAFVVKRGEPLDKCWQAIPDDVDVLITHTPPLGALDLSYSNKRGGCLSLLGHVLNRVKPKYHIFGHIHESHGVLQTESTTFINAAIVNRSYQPKNYAVVFDVPIPNGFSKRELSSPEPAVMQEIENSLGDLELNC